MKKLVLLLFITIVLTACQPAATPEPTAIPMTASAITPNSRPIPPPVEFAWKIAGAPNPFKKPVGVTADSQGNIYVMDAGSSRVQKFDSDGSFLLMWGNPGDGDGQFSITLPDEGRLAVDTQGNIFVLDVGNFRIQKFDSNGIYLAQWGTPGNDDGQFAEPSDIAIDRQNDIYIVDYQNRAVQKFDENGTFVLRWGPTVDVPFAGLYSVAIDPDGNVLVADEGGHIRKFNSYGRFLSEIPLAKLDNVRIDTWNIAVDTQGNIYVADNGGNRIVKLNSQGVILASWRGREIGAGMFNSLQDIAVDEQGNVYVTDSGSNLVQKFRQHAFQQ